MDPQVPESQDGVADVFAEFLDRVEAGTDGDFDGLCAAHPALAERLRKMHVHWQALTGAFSAMSSGDGAAAPSIAGLMARLQARGGRLARYALGPEIASGAMGRVVEAWDEELRREVALKFQREHMVEARAQRRFLEEAQITGQLDHPGIVPIHELGLDDQGRPFFAMRLVRGRDFGEVLRLLHRGDAEWTRARVIGVLLRVCEAMAYAHDKGVVHRDLKPSNVMVGRFGETYVMDWGLARVVGTAGGDGDSVQSLRADIADEMTGDSPLLTRVGEVVGTPPYMAPEQAAGGAHVADPRLDVYSVGAILYHLLSGHAPYAESQDRLGSDAVVAAVRSGPPKPLPDDVPPELRAICERAMARLPDDRYARIEDLGGDLRAFLELRVVQAYATGRFAELRKWVARNRALSVSFAALLLAIVAFAIVAGDLWVAADRDRARADAAANGLATELERSRFQSARQSLQLDDWIRASTVLWQQHLTGAMPRATAWALQELVMRTPCLVTRDVLGNLPVAFVPAAHAAVVGREDGVLGVFDAALLAPRGQVAGGAAAVMQLAVVPGTTQVLTCDAGGVVRRCDIAAPERPPEVVANGVKAIAALAGGDFLTGDLVGGAVRRWPAGGGDGQVVCRVPGAVGVVGIDPTGRTLFAGDLDGAAVVHELATGIDHRLRFRGAINSMSFAPSGRQVWVGAWQTVAIVDLVECKVLRTEPTRNGTCRAIVHESEDSVLVGGWWRIDRYTDGGDRVEPFAQRGIWQLALDPAAKRLLVSSGRYGIGLFDTSGGARRDLPTPVVALAGDGRRYAQYLGGFVTVCDTDSGDVVAKLPCPRAIRSQVFDRAGRRFAQLADVAMRAQVFDVATGALLLDSDGPNESPMGASMLLSPDGETLDVVVGWDRVRRLRVATGEVMAERRWPGHAVLRLAPGPDGAVAVLLRGLHAVELWQPRDGSLRELDVPERVGDDLAGSLSAVAFSPDGGTLVVGTWSGLVFVRDVGTGDTRAIKAHAGTVWSVQLFPNDARLLLTSGGSNGIALWDLDTGACCHQMLQEDPPVSLVQVSDDGRTLAAASAGAAVVLDLTYWQRHVAAGVEPAIATLPDDAVVSPQRVAELRAWAAQVLAAPWPRWRK